MNILLTGSTGFLGSYLLKSFINKKYNVVALKRSTSKTHRIDHLVSQCTLYDIDKIDINEVFEKHAINGVINTVTNYGGKDTKLSSIVDTNLIFGLKIIEASVNHRVGFFINTDTLLPRDINAYALSKAQSNDWMKFFSSKKSRMINVKIELIYGPKDDVNKFVSWLIIQLKQNVKSIDLTNGIQKRDFIYIDDVVNAYNTIIENICSLSNYEEIELGNGCSIELKSFINLILNELSSQQVITTKLNFGNIPYRLNENMDMQANIQKLKNLSWQPTTSIEDGIKNVIKNL